MNEKMNKEAETAKQVANTLNLQFEFLKRDLDYYPSVLEETSSISNLNNWFDKIHFTGFKDKIRKNSDYIFSGHYSDTILGDRIQNVKIRFPIIKEIKLPFKKNYSDLNRFDEEGKLSRKKNIPQYLEETLFSKTGADQLDDKKTTFYGVHHSSMDDFLVGPWYYYPITNTFSYIAYYSLVQMIPVRYPFLDNRMLDFSLKMPLNYLLRKDIVNSSLCRCDEDLAKIPRAFSGLTLCQSKLMHLLGKEFPNFIQKMSYSSVIDASSWPDHNDVVRKSDIIGKKLSENDDILRECDFIHKNKVLDIYDEHLDGQNHYKDIYPLLTFLVNPISKKITFE